MGRLLVFRLLGVFYCGCSGEVADSLPYTILSMWWSDSSLHRICFVSAKFFSGLALRQVEKNSMMFMSGLAALPSPFPHHRQGFGPGTTGCWKFWDHGTKRHKGGVGMEDGSVIRGWMVGGGGAGVGDVLFLGRSYFFGILVLERKNRFGFGV